MNIFFLFGQAAWIPETKADKEYSDENSSSGSYGTFVSSNMAVTKHILAGEFVVTIDRRRSL